jgi:hypothetical protein
MADNRQRTDAPIGSQPVSDDERVDRTSLERDTDTLGTERRTSDPGLVTTERQTGDGGAVRSISSVRTDRRAELRARYGGFYWGSDFIGFAVATFFTIVFLGIIAAVAGGVGYQVGAPLPKIGHSVSSTTQTIGIGAAIASLIGLFIAYIIGGYTAGRMARFDGVKNGIGVVIWTVIVGVILGVAGGILGNKFNVASQLHLNINSSTFTTAGIVALAVSLIVMLLGAMLGGLMGERYHRKIDRDAGVTV